MEPKDGPPTGANQRHPDESPLIAHPRSRQVSLGVNGWRKIVWGSSNHVREGAADPQHELQVVTLYTSRIMDHLGVQQLLSQTVQLAQFLDAAASWP